MVELEEIILEDRNVEILSFLEWRHIKEKFENFLPDDVDKKREHSKEVFDMIHKSYARPLTTQCIYVIIPYRK